MHLLELILGGLSVPGTLLGICQWWQIPQTWVFPNVRGAGVNQSFILLHFQDISVWHQWKHNWKSPWLEIKAYILYFPCEKGSKWFLDCVGENQSKREEDLKALHLPVYFYLSYRRMASEDQTWVPNFQTASVCFPLPAAIFFLVLFFCLFFIWVICLFNLFTSAWQDSTTHSLFSTAAHTACVKCDINLWIALMSFITPSLFKKKKKSLPCSLITGITLNIWHWRHFVLMLANLAYVGNSEGFPLIPSSI